MRHFVLGLCLSFSSLGFAASGRCVPQSDVLASLQCIAGLRVDEVKPASVPGYRQFEMKFTQPVDMNHPDAEQFEQRLVLLHKDWNNPMVLQTSGYEIFGIALTRLAQTFGANQLQVEHRYFAGSTPASRDWHKLDIVQSAADFHRITVAFKQLYRQRWVNTGASKGGMTSTYHRRFYPQDLDGTVADVAPLSFSTEDERYVGFVADQAGGVKYAGCRAKLEALQQALLARREELLPQIEGSFSQLGNVDTAFEHAVIELSFAFWQYQSPQNPTVGCAHIPAPDAPSSELLDYLLQVNDISGYGDPGFATFGAYYFQAGTQLGGPGSKLSHLDLHHSYSLDMYMPHDGITYPYSNGAMLDIERWIRTEAKGMIFVYGEFDPWTAGAYPQVEGRDMHRYFVPGANHGAKFTSLPATERREVLTILQGWFNRAPVALDPSKTQRSLDEIELEARRRLHL